MHPEKYSSPPILTAQDMLDAGYPARRRRAAPQTVLIFMSKTMMDHAVRITAATQSSRVPASVFLPRRTTGVGLLGNIGVGGASVVAHLELLAAWGVKQVVLAGTAGGLLPSIHFEDIVIPSQSFRNDGVSDHYLPPAEWAVPSLKLNQTLAAGLTQIQSKKARSIPFPAIHEAPVWTTASVFRETQAEVKAFGQQGMVAVEMETASLFAAAERLNIAASAVLVISDSLATGTHQLAPKQHQLNQVLYQVTKTLIHLFKH